MNASRRDVQLTINGHTTRLTLIKAPTINISTNSGFGNPDQKQIAVFLYVDELTPRDAGLLLGDVPRRDPDPAHCDVLEADIKADRDSAEKIFRDAGIIR